MRVGDVYDSKNYGSVVVIDYVNSGDVIVRFLNTGFERSFRSRDIRNGHIRDPMLPIIYGVGFIGDGVHKASIEGVKNSAYTTWGDMIRRCYCEKFQKKNPTYKGCTVCDEWLNFQNFAEWYERNYPKDGNRYQLDKDIKINGNKTYGPESCLFVTHKVNSSFSHSKCYVFTTPKNRRRVFIRNMTEFCRRAGLNSSAMIQVAKGRYKSHRGWRLDAL